MKQFSITLGIVLICFSGVTHSQRPNPDNVEKPGRAIVGRIVRYDWFLHETSINEDFAVRVLNKHPDAPSHVRVVYLQSFWDSPPMPEKKLDRLAFIGRGITLEFLLRKPRWPAEKEWCDSVSPDFFFEDEDGVGKIPRFIPTPGATDEKVPKIENLPCFILTTNELKSPQDTKSRIFTYPPP